MKVGLIGHPTGHSLSAAIHNAEFARLGLTEWTYELWDTLPADLGARVRALRDDADVCGFNVTVPHKLAVMEFLDAVDDEARLIGAVNTVVRDPKSGTLMGHNTDCDGWITDIDAVFGAQCLRDGTRVALLGNGGASRAIAMGCVKRGAAAVLIVCRREDAGMCLAGEIEQMYSHTGHAGTVAVTTFASLSAGDFDACDLVVNCTPVGMRGVSEGACPLPAPLEVLRPRHCVYDTIYTPTPTRLTAEARAAGCRGVSNGAGMLARQGALAFKHWTGRDADAARMLRTIKENSH